MEVNDSVRIVFSQSDGVLKSKSKKIKLKLTRNRKETNMYKNQKPVK